MAEPTQLTQHIESYVDSSRSLAQQAASLEAIVLLLRSNVVTIGSLVKEMEMYLTTTDDIIRARGILLLGEVLGHLLSMPLDNTTVHSLVAFFTERLADWRALRGALVGCLALLRRKTIGIVTGADAKAVGESYLQNLQVQSLAQYDRKLCFELMECLLENYPDAVASVGEDLIYGICEAVDGEKDPQCLMLTFHIVELLVKLFPDPNGPLSNFAGDLFGILGCYFPIHFIHPKAEDTDVKKDDLSRALMLAFSSTSLFEPFAMPLLLEKFSSSLPSAKVDSLKYLSYCTLKFGAERVAKHAGAIWSSLKDAIYSAGEESTLSSNPESPDDPDPHKNEIAAEALLLLEKLIVQNNDLFMSMIISDEEVNIIFNTISNYKSYSEIPLPNKQKLHMVGRIIYVCAKASIPSCNGIFANFFSRVIEALGISVENKSNVCHSNVNSVTGKLPNYGSLYLCVKLLGACKDLTINSENVKSRFISGDDACCCLLRQFSTSLTEIFISSLATPAHDVDMRLGVKGLEILATYRGGYLLVSKCTYDNILMALTSIITNNFDKKLLWNKALEALVQIGSSIHKCNESDKEMSYMDIVVDKVIFLVSSADSYMPWSLKLTAISSIGMSGKRNMLRVFLGLEEAICANLAEIYVQGNLTLEKILLQLLECYSTELLPWIQKTEGFEEVLMQFVVNLWNQLEKYKAFDVVLREKESLLDAMVKVMKDAVACCSVESQNVITSKAFGVLSSSSLLPLKESLSDKSRQVKNFGPVNEMNGFCSRDEWILSLFTSVIIALRPQTHIPNSRAVLHLFITALLEGRVTAAQALGSLVNKLDLMSDGAYISGDCTFEEALDMIFSKNEFSSLDSGAFGRLGQTSNRDEMGLSSLCIDASKPAFLRIPAIIGLAWVGKGLLMRGHERVRDITMVFLNCLLFDGGIGASPLNHGSFENNHKQDLHETLMKSAADAFQILMSDSEACLNRKYHAIVRPLYKQRFYSSIMPILYSLISKSDSFVSRSMLHRAFAHVVSDTPLVVILNDAKKLIAVLLDCLTLLSKDVINKDIVYGLLLVLSGILTDKNGKEAMVENAHIIVKGLIELIAYPHMMLIRETAIQCLVALSELPQTRIYPLRVQVLQAISKALDDPKRAVRQEAVKCRQAWSVL